VTHISLTFQFKGATVESVNEAYGLPIRLRVVGKQEVFDHIYFTELPKLERSELCPVVTDNHFGNTMLGEQLAKDCHG
jgi:hypothetical protein